MPNITFYAPQEFEERLRQRGLYRGENIVRRDLERYYALLAESVSRVTNLFSDSEMALLQDALHGIDVQPVLVPHLQVVLVDAVGDARADGLDEKWGVDVDALVEKISSLTTLEALVLVDAVETFWESQRE